MKRSVDVLQAWSVNCTCEFQRFALRVHTSHAGFSGPARVRLNPLRGWAKIVRSSQTGWWPCGSRAEQGQTIPACAGFVHELLLASSDDDRRLVRPQAMLEVKAQRLPAHALVIVLQLYPQPACLQLRQVRVSGGHGPDPGAGEGGTSSRHGAG